MEKLDRLFADIYAADNSPAYLKAHNALQDYLEREGGMSPEHALIAALLLCPERLNAVRAIMPTALYFMDSDSAAIYTAMLQAPCSSEIHTWWRAVATVLETIGRRDVPAHRRLSMAFTYAWWNANFTGLYTVMIVRAYCLQEALSIADEVARAGADPVALRALSGRVADTARILEEVNHIKVANTTRKNWKSGFAKRGTNAL